MSQLAAQAGIFDESTRDLARIVTTTYPQPVSRWPAVAAAVLAMGVMTSCGGGPSGADLDRIRAGVAAIAANPGQSFTLSYARSNGDSADYQTLSCLSVDSDAAHPDGRHLSVVNWGRGAALADDGSCQGNGNPHEVDVDGNNVYVEAGPAPKNYHTCGKSMERKVLTADARKQLAAYTHSQGPNLDGFLAAATSSSTNYLTVTLKLDPQKIAAAASGTATATPDHETMAVTFTSATSKTIQSTEIEAHAGGDTLYIRTTYPESRAGSVAPSPHCLVAKTGTVINLDQITAALGF